MATDLLPGAVFAGYRIESVIGRGAMAVVYRARSADGRVVALKLLDPALARDDRFEQRFRRESELAAQLDEPHVVRTLASGEEDGRLYLVLEHVEGVDLRRLLRSEGRLSPDRAVDVVEQIAAALGAAHREGLIHRDVKPGNILVDGERALLCDFGLARHVSSVGSLTGDRGFVGTIDYVPPEQIEGAALDARADVYSLGCVLFECLAGVPPFDRDTELAVVYAHLNEPPPRITDVRPELPVAFDTVFATALAKSPPERYRSCPELAAAARAALRGEARGRRRPERRLAAVVAGVLAAAAAVVSGVLLARSPAARPVTITPVSIEGAQLGDTNGQLQTIWGTGYQLLGMQEPAGYSELLNNRRDLSAYFVGAKDRAVEITTWNSNDRTAAGVGPCSSLAALRRAYGARLIPDPHAVHGSTVSAYTVGKHLLFAMGLPSVTTVEAVGIYRGSFEWASFNVQNVGPCTSGPPPVTTPAPAPAEIAKPLPQIGHPTPFCPFQFGGPCLGALKASTYTTQEMQPKLTYTVPSGWLNFADHPGTVDFVPPGGDFHVVDDDKSNFLDVFTRITAARAGCNVQGPSTVRTPAAILRSLKGKPGLVVSNEHRVNVGGLAGTVVDLRMRPGSTAICTDPPPPTYVPVLAGLPPSPGNLYHAVSSRDTMRLYLLGYKGGTLAIEIVQVGGGSKLDAYSKVVDTFRFALR